MTQPKKVFYIFLPLTIVLCFLFAFSPATAATKMPNIIGLATYPSGYKGYAIATGLSNAIQKKSGIKVRAMPVGTNMARMKTVIKGEALLGAIYENGLYAAQGGFWSFLNDGPQDLSMAWLGYIGNGVLMTRANSGIKTWDDIKGKRVSNYKDYDPGTGMLVEAMLAWGEVSYSDVKSLPATYKSGMVYLKDGKVDVAEGTASAALVYEMASSVHGIRLFEFDPNDKAAIKRFKSICPIAGPGKVPVGYGYSVEKPGNIIVFPGCFITRPSNDEELVYTVVMSIVEGYDLYKDSHPEAKYWSLESALNMDTMNLSGLPYHTGSVKAFKELGKWTDRHEKWQQSRLAFKDTVREEYKRAVLDAKAKNIEQGTKAFEELWYPKFKALRVKLALEEY